MTQNSATPAAIGPVEGGADARPLWSVMIPTYNSTKYLAETLESVLRQAPAKDRMQIAVVDNCSTEDDPGDVVKRIGKGRIEFARNETNVGLVGNFNSCIKRSRGHLIHLLHSDDFVSPGFYAEIERLAAIQPERAWLATRCFHIDDDGFVSGVSARIPTLEAGGHDVEPFYYFTAVDMVGVVIRREFYESSGGFIASLVHVVDREMWVRAISAGGGIISPRVLANYRIHSQNDSNKITRSGENVRDLLRLTELFESQYQGYSSANGRRSAANLALNQARRFSSMGDAESADANWRLWRENATYFNRLKETLRTTVRRLR